MNGEAELLSGVLFGSVGFGFFIYGKKQSKLIPLICGIALMILPYFMPNIVALILAGLVLLALVYVFRF